MSILSRGCLVVVLFGLAEYVRADSQLGFIFAFAAAVGFFLCSFIDEHLFRQELKRRREEED